MSTWSLTYAGLVNKIDVLARNIMGVQRTTYLVKQIIRDAVNEAMIEFAKDTGVKYWRFLTTDVTAVTVASQGYVDIDAAIFNIILGTMLIPAEDKILYPLALETSELSDPGENRTGCPDSYALDAGATATSIRLLLRPIPDAVYTLSFKAESIKDSDQLTDYPAWVHGTLKLKAQQIALRDLGLLSHAVSFGEEYKASLIKDRTKQGQDGPQHIMPPEIQMYNPNLQSRASS